MEPVHIVSYWMQEDGRVTGVPFDESIIADGLRVMRLRVRPLSDGWRADTESEFGSGAGPIFAVRRALDLLGRLECDVVVIRGEEPLRTAYSREERRDAMDIYDGYSIPEGYDRVATEFCRVRGIGRGAFLDAARALEQNYRTTAKARGLEPEPDGRHDAFVTSLFRRVDCAHPVIDFAGEVVLARADVIELLEGGGPRVTGCAVAEIEDGIEHAEAIARYDHLRRVIEAVEEQRGVLPNPLTTDVAMELYTCFPVVPLACIEAAGWAGTGSFCSFLRSVPITLSGGMNFARAPWNQPALRGLVLAAEQVAKRGGLGLVHGNGGLGAKQGICTLQA